MCGLYQQLRDCNEDKAKGHPVLSQMGLSLHTPDLGFCVAAVG